MPDCPNCHVALGFGLEGGICPKCLTIYNPKAISKMPGYDRDFIMKASEVYVELFNKGLLQPGLNKVDFVNGGLVITHVEALD